MKKFHDTKPAKCTELFLRYLCYNITLNIPTRFSPQRTIIRIVLTFMKAAAKVLYIKIHQIYRINLQKKFNISTIWISKQVSCVQSD